MDMNQRITKWCRGHAPAIEFALKVWTIAQTWDDLWDGDPVDRAHTDDVLAWLAFGNEISPFFRDHAHILRPALLQMWLQWQAANALEQDPTDENIAKSFMLRAGYYGFLHQLAWLVGGSEWAREVAAEIYQSYGESAADIAAEIKEAS